MTAVILGLATIGQKLSIPMYASKVQAGFPSPAQDYVERTLDLNELCIRNPHATFFVKVEGCSMVEAGIYEDDILVVDRSYEAEHGDIVVAAIGTEFTVKELALRPNVQLLAHNKDFAPINIKAGEELNIFGVVTNIIRQLKR